MTNKKGDDARPRAQARVGGDGKIREARHRASPHTFYFLEKSVKGTELDDRFAKRRMAAAKGMTLAELRAKARAHGPEGGKAVAAGGPRPQHSRLAAGLGTAAVRIHAASLAAFDAARNAPAAAVRSLELSDRARVF